MEHLRGLLDERVKSWCAELPADGLHVPMVYILGLPGKRVRPLLTLMACELFGGTADMALDEALGIEVFHNFTLMHDDIMDASPLRRGLPTVHKKWSEATAILSGDAMLVHAYGLMARDPGVLSTFGRYALEVCQGQQADMEFEQRADVEEGEYLAMIRRKTAVLLSCALEVGALRAGAQAADVRSIAAFGEHLGMAFQLKDDLLDAFGDPTLTGKQRGGDLRAGKRTALLIRALAWSNAQEDDRLSKELAKPGADRDMDLMLDVIQSSGAKAGVEQLFAEHHREALAALASLPVGQDRKEPLEALAVALLGREL